MEDTVVTQLPEDQSSLPSFCPSFNCYTSGELIDIAVRVSRECSRDVPEGFSVKLPLDELSGGGGEDTVVTQLPEDQSSLPSFCPSFNCYTSGELIDIAVRVSRECSRDVPEGFSAKLPLDELSGGGGGGGGGDDFEFVSVRVDHGASTSFPIFNRDLLLDVDERNDRDRESGDGDDEASVLVPLKNLFLEERSQPTSSSSSEADELEGVSPGTYCVWKPKREVESSPSRCSKSKSTGSLSKRWPRLRDFLRRSNSEGKDSSLAYLNHSPNPATKNQEEKKAEKTSSSSQPKANRAEKLSAHELFYVRNKALKEGNRRRSYLPYRQDLVGIFANTNGLPKSFPPF